MTLGYDVEPKCWTPRERALWRRIAAHPFERADHALDFTRRLARDRGWSCTYARGAVEEYRRFCFLAVICGGPVTPSEEVDEVWHQHLVYSRDYWDAWCANVLEAPLHHEPTEGGPAEGSRYRAQYAETLALYEAWFGVPEQAYWPATHRRFAARPRFRVIDRDRSLVLPRPAWPHWFTTVFRSCARLGVSVALLLHAIPPAHAETLPLPLDPFDWPAKPFLTLYVSLCAATLAFVVLLQVAMRRAAGGSASAVGSAEQAAAAANELDLLHLAWLAGGRGRAADMVLAGFVDAGAARVAGAGRGIGFLRLPEIEVDGHRAVLEDPFATFRGLIQGPLTYKAFVRAVTPGIEAVGADLARRNLVPVRSKVIRAHVMTAVAVGSVAMFGLIKVAVGHARDRPVGYLLGLIVLTVVLSALIAILLPLRTALGGVVLDWYRERYRRAASAPRQHEVLFAFALTGTAVLTGTHLDEVGRLIRANASGGGSDSGSSGGDGGGGGCGGCGGGGD